MNVSSNALETPPVGVAAAASALARGEITSVALTELYLSRIAARDGALNSYLVTLPDSALVEAAASDARRAAGQARGPLDGVPIGIKDNIDVAGVATTGGIGALRGRIAATDAPVIARLRAAGAAILGKLNMHEGAHGATTDNIAYGRCHNPHRHGFSPGGSSGGSAAALAAGLCAGALGTDTLGSIRIPAALCGVAGIKPTRGLVSARGVLSLCWTLDHVGPMAPRVADLPLMLQAMASFDADDAMACQAPPWMTLAAGSGIAGLRLGRLTLTSTPELPIHPDVIQAYARALDILRDLGATIHDVDLGDYQPRLAPSRVLLIIKADAAVIHAADLTRDPEGFTPAFRQSVEMARTQTAAQLAEGYRYVRNVEPLARRVFAGVDAIIMPTMAIPAFSHDEPTPAVLPMFTAFANYTGGPAVSVPMGKTADGLPLGLQVVTPAWEDARALGIAAAYEAAAHHDMTPA